MLHDNYSTTVLVNTRILVLTEKDEDKNRKYTVEK